MRFVKVLLLLVAVSFLLLSGCSEQEPRHTVLTSLEDLPADAVDSFLPRQGSRGFISFGGEKESFVLVSMGKQAGTAELRLKDILLQNGELTLVVEEVYDESEFASLFTSYPALFIQIKNKHSGLTVVNTEGTVYGDLSSAEIIDDTRHGLYSYNTVTGEAELIHEIPTDCSSWPWTTPVLSPDRNRVILRTIVQLDYMWEKSINYILTLDCGEAVTFQPNELNHSTDMGPYWSPDGNYFFFCNGVYTHDGHRLLDLTELEGFDDVHGVVFSPDSRWLGVFKPTPGSPGPAGSKDYADFAVCDIATGQIIRTYTEVTTLNATKSGYDAITAVWLTRDSLIFEYNDDTAKPHGKNDDDMDDEIRILDLKTGDSATLISQGEFGGGSLELLSPDGKKLVARQEYRSWIFDLKSGQEIMQVHGVNVAWAPDSTRAACNFRGNVILYDTVAKSEQVLTGIGTVVGWLNNECLLIMK